MKVYACIPTRDGIPGFQVAQKLSAACERVGATWGHTTCPYGVEISRNQAVALAYSQPGVTHLFMCDNDTHIPPDTLERLLALDAPIASGVTPTTYRRAGHPAVPCLNIAFEEVPHGEQPSLERNWFHGVHQVRYCGGSCILVHMNVFETLGFPWWQFTHLWNGRKYTTISEDLTFCNRATEAGFEIWVDGDVRCKHDRTIECSVLVDEGREYDADIVLAEYAVTG